MIFVDPNKKTCYSCNSTYRVFEIDPEKGVFSCSGICKDKYLKKKELLQQREKQAAPKTPDFHSSVKVGDPCRILSPDDNVEYEATILSINEDQGQKFVQVNILGFDREETHWLVETLPSKGQQAREKQEKDARDAAQDVVVEAPAYTEGDFCRAIYSADGGEYEATVISKGESEGVEYRSVRFLGYGNEETVWLTDLLPSKGEEARKEQERPFAAAETPTREWKVDEFCRGTYTADGNVYEATVVSVNHTDDGQTYCKVRFIGYGNEENIWVKDLQESLGEEARKKQEKEALGEVTEAPKAMKEWAVGDSCRATYSADGNIYEATVLSVGKSDDGNAYCRVVFLGYGNEENIWVTDMLDSLGEDARKKQEKEVVGEVAEAPKAEKEWAVGDFCRATYTVDGVEYEGVVISSDKDQSNKSYHVVRFIGYGNEETFWTEQLLPSHGKEAQKKQEVEATGGVYTEIPAVETVAEAKHVKAPAVEEKPVEVPVVEEKPLKAPVVEEKPARVEQTPIEKEKPAPMQHEIAEKVGEKPKHGIDDRPMARKPENPKAAIYEEPAINVKVQLPVGAEAQTNDEDYISKIKANREQVRLLMENIQQLESLEQHVDAGGDSRTAGLNNEKDKLIEHLQAEVQQLREEKAEMGRHNVELSRDLKAAVAGAPSSDVTEAILKLNEAEKKYKDLEEKYKEQLEASIVDMNKLLQKHENAKKRIREMEEELAKQNGVATPVKPQLGDSQMDVVEFHRSPLQQNAMNHDLAVLPNFPSVPNFQAVVCYLPISSATLTQTNGANQRPPLRRPNIGGGGN